MVHDYPKEKAFVYDNKIDVKDPENKNVLRDLSYNLDNYWDDSLKVRKIRQFGVFNTIVQPTTYYPERIERTIQYMRNYLATKGYNQPTLNLQTRVDTVKNEWRVYLKMEVALNKKTIIDTVTYQLGDNALQILAEKADYDKIQEDDSIDVTGLTSFAPGTPLTLVLTHKDGTADTIKANHTYNQPQIEWFKAGGALNIIRKQVGK